MAGEFDHFVYHFSLVHFLYMMSFLSCDSLAAVTFPDDDVGFLSRAITAHSRGEQKKHSETGGGRNQAPEIYAARGRRGDAG